MRFAALLTGLLLAATAAFAGIPDERKDLGNDGFWSEWSDATFERAAAGKKFVIVSLQSWWCPWCHVMNKDTWANADVRATLKDNFIPVFVDQDARPDISQRYDRWGWPATIIFGADGSEIVKLRGFYSPQFLIPILKETIRDPSPVDYGTLGGAEQERRLATALSEAQRAGIVAFIDKAWDQTNGGWGKSKLVDGPTLAWFLDRAKAGDKDAEAKVRRTLTAMAALIDKDLGGISQVSLKPDWSATSHEFPMFAQQAALANYALAAKQFGDAAYRDAADRIYGFLKNTLRAPEGGFRHSERDAAGPYLADNIEMAAALLALHRSTGERKWLTAATATAEFVARTFIDPKTGGFMASASPDARHLPKPIKQREDNVTSVPFFTLLAFYSGNERHREIAEAGMGYLTSPPVIDAYAFLPDVLLAEEELKNEPVHVTVVGARDDPRSAPLYAAALAYPLAYKRAEWWDKREGKLANPDVDYPDFPDGPAAFACTRNYCSLPVTEAAAIPGQIDRLQRALRK